MTARTHLPGDGPPDPPAVPAMRVLLAGRVARFAGFQRHVTDLQRSIAFYRDGLGFQHDTAAPAPWSLRDPPPTARLRLGAQSIELIAGGDGPPSDRYARGRIDTGFQHLAIVAADMASAFARLQARGSVPISRGGPVRLPASAGGVSAFKFLDPDGHPLELIQFPPGSGDPAWQRRDAAAGPTLGIDHSAIVVTDVDRSIAFYRELLGFEVVARQVNQGPTQARLDGIDAVVVDVVALRPAREQTPHLELLGYRRLTAPPLAPVRRADQLLWWSDSPSGAVAPRQPLAGAPGARSVSGVSADFEVHDPDGHRHRVVETPA